MHTSNCRFAAIAALGLLAAGINVAHGAIAQAPLDPNAFASLGSLTATDSVVFNTGDGTSAPTVTFHNTMLVGVISGGVAVFDFSNIDLTSSATVTAKGALPLALLSRRDVNINGTIDVSATDFDTPGAGGGSGGALSNLFHGGGPGGGMGSNSGGSFGGVGGNGQPTYGDATHAFFGGSGGGGSIARGGPGGGGIEISALDDIVIAGSILANGFHGGAGGISAGGGSGGGIFLATPDQITLSGLLSATGGYGEDGFIAGGGGGGGRILLETDLYVTGGSPAVNVAGGPSGTQSGDGIVAPGGLGTFAVTSYVAPIPEPASLASLMIGGLILRRRARK